MTGSKPLKTYKGSGATGKGICTTSQFATRNKASRTNSIALFGFILQAVCVRERKDRKTMDRLLRAFAGEQLQIIEVTETQSPKRKKLIDESYKLHNELEKKLNNEEKELLERLFDIGSEEKILYAEDKFIRGYRLGVLMTMEVFAGHDKFLFEGRTE